MTRLSSIHRFEVRKIQPSYVAALLATLLTCLIVSLGALAQGTLTREIGGKARGAFDILVRPLGLRSNTESTAGLVEPDYLAFTGAGGIPFADLRAIRAIDGVQVAAPISIIGQVSASFLTPGIAVPTNSTATAYRFTLTESVNDGIRPHNVSQQSLTAIVPSKSAPSSETAAISAPGSTTLGDNKTGYELLALPLPPISYPIVAVDPTAEQQLIGHRITALSELGYIRGTSKQVFNEGSLRQSIQAAESAGKLKANVALTESTVAPRAETVVPVVVASQDPADVSMSLTTQVIDSGTHLAKMIQADGSPQAALSSVAQTGTVIRDLPTTTTRARIRPLAQAVIGAHVPGASTVFAAGGGGTVEDVSGLLMRRPTYTLQPTGDGRVSVRIAARGPGSPIGPLEPGNAGLTGQTAQTVGHEQTYRAVKRVGIATGRGTVAFHPVDGFAIDQLRPTGGALGRVSLGVYDVPKLVVAHSHLASTGTVVQPTLNPAGLVVRPPGALADIRDAALMRGPKPIDAIRVRVSGLKTVDDATEHRVAAIASQIASLGLDVDVVIGSSPQRVSIDVPQYEAGGAAPTRDLGGVTQEWTTVGAAVRVSHSLGHTSIALAALAAAVVLVAAIGAQVMESAALTRDSAILRIAGWRRRRVLWRQLQAPLVGALLGVALAALVWSLTGRDRVMGMIGVGVVLTVPAAASITRLRAISRNPITAARAGDAARGRARFPLSSVVGLALRAIIARPARAAALTSLLICFGACAGAAFAVIAARGSAAGPTLLAADATERLTDLHVCLAAVGALAGALFAVGLWRFDLNTRIRETSILSAIGWSTRAQRTLVALQLTMLGVPAIAVSSVVAGALADTFDRPNPTTAALWAGAATLTLVLYLQIYSRIWSGRARSGERAAKI